MNDFFYFFAYGSSMNPVTLVTRARSCAAVGIGHLAGHRLSFHKRAGGNGQEYAEVNAVETGSREDEVLGVVYRIAAQDRDTLDSTEGVGAGYRRVTGSVDLDGKDLAVDFYVAVPDWVDESLKPYDWYLALVSSGARMHGLPMAYQRMLRRIKTLADPDRRRADEYFQLARKGDSLIPFPRKAVDR
jgi:gamma-glutamylcyclotransferase (GGCT)/AIG2-like uncharacterized protein YtfP